VGGDANPYDIACLAEVVELDPLPDGRFTLLAVGVERVRIRSLDRLSQPYLTGSVEFWPEESRSAEPGTFDEVQKRYLEYAGYLMKLTGKEDARIPVPDEPDLLSYVLATALQLGPLERQRLLEMPACGERLRAELALLDSQIPLLRMMSATPRPPSAGYGQFSAN
jgi:Lon protease-like protein